jgi:3-oxoacyl-[acyl-carrier-protein] synthase-3
MSPGDLDAIISVGSVPAQAIPCTAVLLQRDLGRSGSGIPAFDVNATCVGFVVALDLIAQGIATGRYRTS